ncbi:Box C/D snoRNA protein 1 [Podila humilis]|nr:Box C/D snoRNA protein 1 [Podila humilis]
MDFFTNAFVTRELPSRSSDSNEESDVVTKDGIQIREKVMSGNSLLHGPGDSDSNSGSTDIIKCEICGVINAKYKCPGCFCQTCSLKCSKQHKLDTTCSGVRSRTHFVERKQYSEKDMMSEPTNTVHNESSVEEISLTAAQELERLGSFGSGSYKDKQLILQAKKRAIHLIMMADGLKKRKENNTHWRDK